MRPPLSSLLLLTVCSGCYLSHERERPHDAAPPHDAFVPVDALVPCGPSDIQIETDIFSIVQSPPVPTGGTLFVERAGTQLVEQRTSARTDYRFDVCVPRDGTPLDVYFTLAHGALVLLGVEDDLRDDIWTGASYRGAYRRGSTPSAPHTGQFVRSEPGSRFLLQHEPSRYQWLEETPFMFYCKGIPGACRVRFLEESSDGRLLGGGQSDWSDVGVPRNLEPPLESTERVMREVDVEIALPTDGLLQGLPIADVRPLACEEDRFGPPVPGELDLWSCQLAGVSRVLSVEDGVARVRVTYLDTDLIRANLLSVRLAEGDLEATVTAPCCDRGPIRVAFPLVNDVRISGRLSADIRFDVDAPGYDYAYMVAYNPGAHVVYDHDGDARISDGRLPEVVNERFGEQVPREAWAGAVTTAGGLPWSGGRGVAFVRRHLVIDDDAP